MSETGFSFRMYELSVYRVKFKYPDNWNTLDPLEKGALSHQVAIEIGVYMSYAALTWHEMLTWFGWSSTWVIPEYASAFSWEDNFSNSLGVIVGEKARHSGIED